MTVKMFLNTKCISTHIILYRTYHSLSGEEEQEEEEEEEEEAEKKKKKKRERERERERVKIKPQPILFSLKRFTSPRGEDSQNSI